MEVSEDENKVITRQKILQFPVCHVITTYIILSFMASFSCTRKLKKIQKCLSFFFGTTEKTKQIILFLHGIRASNNESLEDLGEFFAIVH